MASRRRNVVQVRQLVAQEADRWRRARGRLVADRIAMELDLGAWKRFIDL
jgi:hypothetical protein